MPKRFFFWSGALAVSVALVAVALAYRTRVFRAGNLGPHSEAVAVPNESGSDAATAPDRGQGHPPFAGHSSRRRSPDAVTPEILRERESKARELITALTQLDVSKFSITPEQTGEWKRAYEQLKAQGV